MCFCDRAGLSKSLCHAAFYIHHTILEASHPDNTQLNGLVLCCGRSAHAHADMALECDCMLSLFLDHTQIVSSSCGEG